MVLLILSLLVVFGVRPQDLAAQANAVSDQEYAVYSTVLDSLYRGGVRTAFLVSDSTHGTMRYGIHDRDLLRESLEKLPDLPPGLAADYIARNAEPQRLDAARFHTRRPIRLLDHADRNRIGEAMLGESGYPSTLSAHGMVTFSRVGFSSDASAAVLHVFFHCGGRCGDGQFVLLKRDADRWTIQHVHRTVVF